jgi:choice-of-anchor C domain-containing protein
MFSSFEYPLVPIGIHQEYGTGRSLGPWRVESGNVDLIGRDYWQAAEGAQSLDLNGRRPGRIGQVIRTAPGNVYEIQFSLSVNPEGGPYTKWLEVTAGDTKRVFTLDTGSRTKKKMQYLRYKITFTPTGFATAISFRSLTSGPWGPVLDNIVLCGDNCKGPRNGFLNWLIPNAR